MSRTMYLLCACVVIGFGTMMNYSFLDDDDSSRSYRTGGGYVGGFSGGHK